MSTAFISHCISQNTLSPVPEAQACNPSYSEGRYQEGHSSKPAQANSYVRSYLKKPFTKIRLVEWLKVKDMSSSPSMAKINK
jgi:hypothetical protein